MNGNRRCDDIYLNGCDFNRILEERHIERLFALQELNSAYIKSIRLNQVKLPTKFSCLLKKLPNLSSIKIFSSKAEKETTVDNTVLNLKKLRNVCTDNSRIYKVFNYLPSDILRKVDVSRVESDLIHDKNSFLQNQRNIEEMVIDLKPPANGIDHKLCPLSKFKKLRSLDIRSWGGKNYLHCIEKNFLPNLTTLKLGGSTNWDRLPISTMKAIQPKLKKLVLRRYSNNFLNLILQEFDGLNSLEFYSNSSYTKEYVYQEGLSHENLKSLSVKVVGKTEEILKLIGSCRNLNLIDLVKMRVESETIEDILNLLPNLTSLKISCTPRLSLSLLDILKTHGKSLTFFDCCYDDIEEGITEDFIRHEFKHQFQIIQVSFSSRILQMKN